MLTLTLLLKLELTSNIRTRTLRMAQSCTTSKQKMIISHTYLYFHLVSFIEISQNKRFVIEIVHFKKSNKTSILG